MMKRFITAIMFSCFVGAAHAVPATVNYIFDGDTFAAYVNLAPDVRITVRVRLINIDTPEMNGQCDAERVAAARARDRLAQLLPVGATIELKNIKDDKYLGRIDANVILPDGRDVGDVLIAEKHGRPYSGGKRQPWCK